MSINPATKPARQKPTFRTGLISMRGFTLAEIAIVLLIVGLLLSGILMPLGAQIEQRRITETQRRLEEAKEALLGFAIANNRLPCPASATSLGIESFAAGGTATNGNCSNFLDGFLPAATLGLSQIDDQGYAVDGWALGTVSRIRYAVSNTTVNAISNPFTSTQGMKNAGLDNLASKTYLLVCSSATGITSTTCGVSANTVKLTDTAPFIVYSVGGNAASGGSSIDEAANPNPNGGSADIVFVSHTQSKVTGSEFDDIVSWMSLNSLINRLVAAGKLP